MPLNEQYKSLADIPANGGQTAQEIQDAFIGRTATRVLLPAGFDMCKLNNYDNMGTFPTISGWWTAVDRTEVLNGGNDVALVDRIRMAGVTGVSLREICRVYLAVADGWNSFEWLARIRLKEPVYGYYGGVAAQDRKKFDKDGQALPAKQQQGEMRGATAKLPGRAQQLYIPFLTLGHLTAVKYFRMSEIEKGKVPLHVLLTMD